MKTVKIETQGVSENWARADGRFETLRRGDLNEEQVLSAMVHVAMLDTPAGDDPCAPCVTARRAGEAFSFYGQGGALFSPELERELSPADAVDVAFGKVRHAPPPPMPEGKAVPPPALEPAPAPAAPVQRRRMTGGGKVVMVLAVLMLIGGVTMVFGVFSMQRIGRSADDVKAAMVIAGALFLVGGLMVALAFKTRKTTYTGANGQPVDAEGNDLHYLRVAHQLDDYDSDDYDDGGDYAGFD